MILEGYVVHGKHLGRTIGFPTANIEVSHQRGSGPDGVYAAFLDVDEKRYFSMVNIGHHPTLPGGGKTIEVHLFGFDGDLYGKRVRLETAGYIRGEQKFATIEELRSQLEKDKITADRLLTAIIETPSGIE